MASSVRMSCAPSLITATRLAPLTHADIELSSIDSVRTDCDNCAQLVVNTAAMHHVDNCEREPEKAFAVNGLGARNLAVVSRDIGAVLMHVSTDYVFDGAQADTLRGDGRSAAAECLRQYETGRRVLCPSDCGQALRTAHFGDLRKEPCRAKGGLNFVELMLKLAKERGQGAGSRQRIRQLQRRRRK